MEERLRSKVKELESESCPMGGSHELSLEKSEEYPDGTIKYIYVCKKCNKHFEIEL